MRKALPLALAAAVLASAALAASGRLTIAVQEAKIRKKRLFYAPAVATVRFGDKVEAGEKQDGWYAVSYHGTDGWLHESAVSSRSALAVAGRWSGSDQADADETTLAGKGFNDDVEKSYRQGHADLDYAGVDRMERRQVSEPALLRFMKAGGTLPREDAR